jgi:hypothetical protein
MPNPSVRLFLSCVSGEFGAYRDALRQALTRPNVGVKIQEDFKALGGDTLKMLADYRSARRSSISSETWWARRRHGGPPAGHATCRRSLRWAISSRGGEKALEELRAALMGAQGAAVVGQALHGLGGVGNNGFSSSTDGNMTPSIRPFYSCVLSTKRPCSPTSPRRQFHSLKPLVRQVAPTQS